jgi:hypothetical protein
MKTRFRWMTIVLFATLLLAGCSSKLRVDELKTESQSVELGDTESVRVEIEMGAGDLEVTGGAEKLLEAVFNYNVARLKPEVEYTDDMLIVQLPKVKGLPAMGDIADFRNEWDLRLNNEIPMDLSVNMGAGTSDLQLAGLSLTGLDVSLGAGESTIDLSGGWASDLDATIDAGAGDISIRLPRDVGVRVEVGAGVGTIDAPGLKQDGNVYTNDAYGMSDLTLEIDIEAGFGKVTLEVEE